MLDFSSAREMAFPHPLYLEDPSYFGELYQESLPPSKTFAPAKEYSHTSYHKRDNNPENEDSFPALHGRQQKTPYQKSRTVPEGLVFYPCRVQSSGNNL